MGGEAGAAGGGTAGGAAGVAGATGGSGGSGGGSSGGAAGAGGGTAGAGGTGDTTRPTVLSTAPADGAQGVASTPNLSVVFDEPMSSATMSASTTGSACSGTLQLSADDFGTCVAMSAPPTASNGNQTFSVQPAAPLASMQSYKLRVTTAATDAAGNALAAAYTTPGGLRVRYYHRIALDGTNDFTADETFATSTVDFTGYVAWDESALFIGMSGADIGTGASAYKFLLVYLSGTPGTNVGVEYRTQKPSLPFSSRYHVRWRTDGGFAGAREYNGTAWQDAGWFGLGNVERNGNFVELRIPLGQIGNPSSVDLVFGMLIEEEFNEWSYAAVPAAGYTDGYKADFSKFLRLELTASKLPSASSVLP
jgi:hypothetical protein